MEVKMRLGLLEGVFRLPARVLLKVEALEFRVPVRIGTTNVLITTPGVQPNATNTLELVAPKMTALPPGVDRPARYGENGIVWGRIVNWANDQPQANDSDAYIGAVTISRLLSEVGEETEALAEENGRDLHERIDSWWRLVADWIEVLAGQDLDPVSRPGHELDLWFRHGGRGGTVNCPQPFSITGRLDTGLTRKTWQGVLHAASEGRPPPIEYLLLRDCLTASRRKERRRAVLDAATAAEMALSRLLDQELSGERPESTAYIGDPGKHIRERVDAIAKLGAKSPNQLIRDLAELRNRAVHGGVEPGVETTRAVLDLAESVVELAVPRISLLQMPAR
ncbi:MAG: hypothetical protein ACQSGP_28660 [Frankia sp.]